MSVHSYATPSLQCSVHQGTELIMFIRQTSANWVHQPRSQTDTHTHAHTHTDAYTGTHKHPAAVNPLRMTGTTTAEDIKAE